jgi:SAM-dependent methyltransferase
MDGTGRKSFECSVCAGNQFERIYTFGLYSWRQTVSVCQDCGVVCLNPRWDERRYEEYYRTTYWGEYQPRVAVEEPINAEDPRGTRICRDVQQLLGRGAEIMEVGCGGGENLITLRRNGFHNLTGVDPSPECCRRLERYGIAYINQSLESYWGGCACSPSPKFDGVILSHMLEHFVQPDRALEMIGSILKPDGMVYILVPNLYGFSRLHPQFITPHTFYFGKTSLERLLHNCGFVAHRYFETPSDEIALVARRADSKPSVIRDDTAEYRRVLVYMKKKGLGSMRIRLRNALGRLVMTTLHEDTYLTLRRHWRKIPILE